jgi:Arc/MetJ-type ribon-helix-helix transcriptional regulator
MAKRVSKMTELTAVRLTREMREEIEEWRAKLRPIPSQGAAIRQLVRDGLDWHKRKAAGGKRGKED